MNDKKCTKMEIFTGSGQHLRDRTVFFSLGRHKSDRISSYTCRILKIVGDLKSPGPPLSNKHNFIQANPNISPRLSENMSSCL